MQVVCCHLKEFYHSYFFVWLGKVNNFKFILLEVAVSAYKVIFTDLNVQFGVILEQDAVNPYMRFVLVA